MTDVAIQLYTLRDVDELLPDLLDRVGETAFDGVEFAHRFAGADPEAVASALDRTDLDAESAHVGVDQLENDLDDTLDAYAHVDCDTFVVPWLDSEDFAGADAVGDAADRLTELAERVDDRGGSLHYHNHDHELVAIGDRTAFHEFADRSGDALGLQVDFGWVKSGGGDPAAFVESYADRIDTVHVTDCDAASAMPVEVGEGDVDVEACLGAARDAGVDTLVYEHDEPDDPLASLAHGSAYLAE